MITFGPYGKIVGHVAYRVHTRPLAKIHEHLRLGRSIECELPDVLDDSDNLPRRGIPPQICGLADWTPARKLSSGERFIDEQDSRLACTILLIEGAPLFNSYTHRFEVISADEPQVFVRRSWRRLFRNHRRCSEKRPLSKPHHRQLN